MGHRGTRSVVVMLVLSAITATSVSGFGGSGTRSRSSAGLFSASPAATPAAIPELSSHLPDDVNWRLLAAGRSEAWEDAPEAVLADGLPCIEGDFGYQSFELVRIALAPHTDMGQQDPYFQGNVLLYMERGTVVTTAESGLESVHDEGGSLFIPSGANYAVRNDADEPAVVLQLSLGFIAVPAAKMRAPFAAVVGVAALDNPRPERTPVPGVEIEPILFETDLRMLPKDPAILFIAETTWQPGATSGERVAAGVVGLLGEAGTLMVADPASGGDGQLGAKQFVVYQPGDRFQQRNDGAEPARVLMVGIVMAGQELAPLAPASLRCTDLNA